MIVDEADFKQFPDDLVEKLLERLPSAEELQKAWADLKKNGCKGDTAPLALGLCAISSKLNDTRGMPDFSQILTI